MRFVRADHCPPHTHPAYVYVDHAIRLHADAAVRLPDGEPSGSAPVQTWCPKLRGGSFSRPANEKEYIKLFGVWDGARRTGAPGSSGPGALCTYTTRHRIDEIHRRLPPLGWLMDAEGSDAAGWDITIGHPDDVVQVVQANMALDVCPTGTPGCELMGVPGLSRDVAQGEEGADALRDALVGESVTSLSSPPGSRPAGLRGAIWSGYAFGELSHPPRGWSATLAEVVDRDPRFPIPVSVPPAVICPILGDGGGSDR